MVAGFEGFWVLALIESLLLTHSVESATNVIVPDDIEVQQRVKPAKCISDSPTKILTQVWFESCQFQTNLSLDDDLYKIRTAQGFCGIQLSFSSLDYARVKRFYLSITALSKFSEKCGLERPPNLTSPIPFFLAGLGMIASGILLFHAQDWSFFKAVPEAIIIVPTILGLKGNLEMTLSSRLSTQVNMGRMKTMGQISRISIDNIALVQSQAIFLSALASIATSVYAALIESLFDLQKASLLIATATLTGSLASLMITLIIISTVVIAHKFGVNPDNVSVAIAAALGDSLTLILLVGIGAGFVRSELPLPGFGICFALWLIVMLICAKIALGNEETGNVLKFGWMPVLLAMSVASCGGLILQKTVDAYPDLAAYQAVINGAGGNLVAIQVSRISTCLHKTNDHHSQSLLSNLLPSTVFFSKCTNSEAVRYLILLGFVGHIIFVEITLFLTGGDMLDLPFILLYQLASCSQITLLLYLGNFLTHVSWRFNLNPDNYTIPIMTALGDFLGISMLGAAFVILHMIRVD